MAQRFYQKAGVQAAIIGGMFLFIATIITICHQRSELVQENTRLKNESVTQEKKIREQDAELTPLRTVCIEWYGGAGPSNMLKLAERTTQIQSELKQKTDEINTLKSSVEELKPSFSLLNQKHSKDGDYWVTRLYFGNKDGRGLPRFAITVAFDKSYENLKVYACPIGNDSIRVGAGSQINSFSIGDLRIMSGESKSQVCEVFGTQLPDNGNIVLEFRSKDRLQRIISLDLKPISR